MKEAKEMLVSSNPSGVSPLLNEIEKDKELIDELTKLGINEKELPFYVNILFDYKCQKDECSKCPGSAACNSERKISYMRLAINDSGKLSYNLGPCPEEAERERVKANYLYRDFDDDLLSATIKKGQKKNGTEFKLVSCMGNKEHPWAYVTGASGSGKSYKIIGICNDFAKNGFKVAYLNFPQRSEEMKNMAMKDRDNYRRMINRLSVADVLVLDDFGDEYKSDYLFDTVLLPLLLDRARKGKTTYFVSAYSLKELSSIYNSASKTKANVRRIIDLINQKTDGELEIVPSVRKLL